jgi:hemerythrin-like domain-containing protein
METENNIEREPFIERLVVEHNDLSDKIDKLSKFLDTNAINVVSKTQHNLLIDQHKYMVKYLQILKIRLEDLGVSI